MSASIDNVQNSLGVILVRYITDKIWLIWCYIKINLTFLFEDWNISPFILFIILNYDISISVVGNHHILMNEMSDSYIVLIERSTACAYYDTSNNNIFLLLFVAQKISFVQNERYPIWHIYSTRILNIYTPFFYILPFPFALFHNRKCKITILLASFLVVYYFSLELDSFVANHSEISNTVRRKVNCIDHPKFDGLNYAKVWVIV